MLYRLCPVTQGNGNGSICQLSHLIVLNIFDKENAPSNKIWIDHLATAIFFFEIENIVRSSFDLCYSSKDGTTRARGLFFHQNIIEAVAIDGLTGSFEIRNNRIKAAII